MEYGSYFYFLFKHYLNHLDNNYYLYTAIQHAKVFVEYVLHVLFNFNCHIDLVPELASSLSYLLHVHEA